MELEALRIKNLRCLTDTGRIPIRPITVLVGRNSSGKSSFLRAFPLLRQSVETATESPILWFSQALVDFGTFGTAINHHAKDRTITFEFSMKHAAGGYRVPEPLEVHVAMFLAEGIAPHGSYVAEYRIECFDDVASLRFAPDGKLVHFYVNKTNVLPPDVPISLDGSTNLLPRLQIKPSGKVSYKRGHHPWVLDPSGADPLLDQLVEKLRPLYHGRTSDDTLRNIASRMPVVSHEKAWRYLSEVRPQKKKSLRSNFTTMDEVLFGHIFDYAFALHVADMIRLVDDGVADFMSSVQYLRPLRATADRSYRIQDLAVTEVDPDGKNLAMFMYSLSEAERKSFVAFTHEHLGFESKIDLSGLHAEIMVKEPNADRHINLVDIGFGYTEVLPLMAILWSTCCREQGTSNRSTSLLAIEQPELHLHPAHQVKLAHVIANAWRTSRDAGREVKIMVETHSEGIVNGLGDLIEKGVISANDVQLVIFEQDPETRQTNVRLAGYSNDGALNDDWPFGFFAPVAD